MHSSKSASNDRPCEQVDLRWVAAHGESTFDGMIAHFEEYTDVVGDHPSNMVATTLGLNAYALTAESQYRDWVLCAPGPKTLSWPLVLSPALAPDPAFAH